MSTVTVYALRENYQAHEAEYKEFKTALKRGGGEALQARASLSGTRAVRDCPIFYKDSDAAKLDQVGTKVVFKVISREEFNAQFTLRHGVQSKKAPVTSTDIADFELASQKTQTVSTRVLSPKTRSQSAPATTRAQHARLSAFEESTSQKAVRQLPETLGALSTSRTQVASITGKLEAFNKKSAFARFFSFGQPGRLVAQLEKAMYALHTVQYDLQKQFAHAGSDVTFLADQKQIQGIVAALVQTGSKLDKAHAALKQAGVSVNPRLEVASTSQVLEGIRAVYTTTTKHLPKDTSEKTQFALARNLAAVNSKLLESYHADLEGISSQLRTAPDEATIRILQGKQTAVVTKLLKLYKSHIALSQKLKAKESHIQELKDAYTALKRDFPDIAKTVSTSASRSSSRAT